MDNKKKNEIIALAIVILVSVVGFTMIFWFYSVIAPIQIRASDNTTPSINDQILNKVTTSDNSEPLKLEGNDFGRDNPFDNLK